MIFGTGILTTVKSWPNPRSLVKEGSLAPHGLLKKTHNN